MKKNILVVLLCAIVACNSDEELLVMNNYVHGEEEIVVADSVSFAMIESDFWDYIDDRWYEEYGEPYLVHQQRSFTKLSPVGQGSISINYIVSYYCSERLDYTRSKALVEVVGITTSMERNTTKYLMWSDGGSLAGPINIMPDVNAPQRFVDCRIIGTLNGEASFWYDGNNGSHSEYILYHDTFNINNY